MNDGVAPTGAGDLEWVRKVAPPAERRGAGAAAPLVWWSALQDHGHAARSTARANAARASPTTTTGVDPDRWPAEGLGHLPRRNPRCAGITPARPPEFRAAGQLVRDGGRPLAERARNLCSSTESLRHGARQEETENGQREGLTAAEPEELRRLRRENRSQARSGDPEKSRYHLRQRDRQDPVVLFLFLAQEQTLRPVTRLSRLRWPGPPSGYGARRCRGGTGPCPA